MFTELKNTRSVVATELTAAADATGINLTRCTKLPFAPALNARNISVPTVPPPAELTLAAVVVIFASPTFGVNANIGLVFAGIIFSFLFYYKYQNPENGYIVCVIAITLPKSVPAEGVEFNAYDAVNANEAVPCSEPVNEFAVTLPVTANVDPSKVALDSPFKVAAVPVAVTK